MLKPQPLELRPDDVDDASLGHEPLGSFIARARVVLRDTGPVVVLNDVDRHCWADQHAAEISARNGDALLMLDRRWFDRKTAISSGSEATVTRIYRCGRSETTSESSSDGRVGSIWFKAWLTLYWMSLGRLSTLPGAVTAPETWLWPFTTRRPATRWVTVHPAPGAPLPDGLEAGFRASLDATRDDSKGADAYALNDGATAETVRRNRGLEDALTKARQAASGPQLGRDDAGRFVPLVPNAGRKSVGYRSPFPSMMFEGGRDEITYDHYHHLRGRLRYLVRDGKATKVFEWVGQPPETLVDTVWLASADDVFEDIFDVWPVPRLTNEVHLVGRKFFAENVVGKVGSARALLLMLSLLPRADSRMPWSPKGLADQLGVSVDTINRARKPARDLELLIEESRGNRLFVRPGPGWPTAFKRRVPHPQFDTDD